MARPKKQGIDYFPVDIAIDTDKKTYKLEAQCGEVGFARLIKLLAEIYREGYALKWDDDEALTFAGMKRIPVDEVKTLVAAAIRAEWFDRSVYEEHGYLTSAGIQRRYVFACSARTSIPIREELYLLTEEDLSEVSEAVRKKITLVISEKTRVISEETLTTETGNPSYPDEPVEEIPATDEETPVTVIHKREETPQSIGKERKVQQSRGAKGNSAAAAVDNFLEEMIGNAKFGKAEATFSAEDVRTAGKTFAQQDLGESFPRYLAARIRSDPHVANPAAFYRQAFLRPDKYAHFIAEWREEESRASPGTTDRARPPTTCPQCNQPLVQGGADRYGCKPCGVYFEFVDGQWRREAAEVAS